MTNALRRGEIAGAQVARAHPELVSAQDIRQSAALVWAWMMHAGYAHIEPREDFLRGFVSHFWVVRHVLCQEVA